MTTIKSPTLTVDVAPAPTTCSGNCNCPAGQNCVDGQCTPVEITDINVPATASYTGYLNGVGRIHDLITYEKPIWNFNNSEITCNDINGSETGSYSASKTISVSGQVLSGTAGVNKAPLSITYSGPTSFVIINQSASCDLKISYPDNTDCNGNFTVDITLNLTGLPTSSEINNYVGLSPHKNFNLDISPYTITITSKGVSADIIVSIDTVVNLIWCEEFGL
jgi:hypothetical protein